MAQLQTVVSRENHPVYPAVMTIGSIHGGKAPNVIPDFVEMSGTLRSLNAESREKMQAAIDRICISCAEAMRGSAEIRWEKGMPPLVNDRNVIEGLRTAAEKTIGNITRSVYFINSLNLLMKGSSLVNGFADVSNVV